jgi:sulfur-carrier protein
MMKHIDLHHYAIFREARGTGIETLETAAATPRELFGEMGLGEVMPIATLRVAVNDRITSWDEPLRDGDRVVFLAPMAGG